MSRNGSGVYSVPANTEAVSGQTISSAKFNSRTDDMAADLNVARPVVAGGTGATSASAARTNLGVPSVAEASATATSVATTIAATAAALRGHIEGLELANNSTDSDHDIDIAVGSATSDDVDAADRVMMEFGTGLSKRIDANWSFGDAAGGLDVGIVAVDTWYHVYLIHRTDLGSSEILFSTSVISPSLPANYTKKRLIGSVLTDGSANIIGFFQKGDHFYWNVSVEDFLGNTVGTASVNRTMTVPTGRPVVWNGLMSIDSISSAGSVSACASPLGIPELAAVDGQVFARDVGGTSTNVADRAALQIVTDSSAQIRTRVSVSSVNVALLMRTYGWIDDRGRNS